MFSGSSSDIPSVFSIHDSGQYDLAYNDRTACPGGCFSASQTMRYASLGWGLALSVSFHAPCLIWSLVCRASS